MDLFLFPVTMYNVYSVIEAFALTFAVTVALTVYTLQSKRDFSSWGARLVTVYELSSLEVTLTCKGLYIIRF